MHSLMHEIWPKIGSACNLHPMQFFQDECCSIGLSLRNAVPRDDMNRLGVFSDRVFQACLIVTFPTFIPNSLVNRPIVGDQTVLM